MNNKILICLYVISRIFAHIMNCLLISGEIGLIPILVIDELETKFKQTVQKSDI
jgi:hypothetical protein